jgi:small subunit ribosomal protein S6
MTVFSPDVPEEELAGAMDRVSGYVTAATGAIVDVSRDSPWGRRRLAYPIRHGGRDVRDGFFVLYHLQVEPHRVTDIERDLKIDDRVIRYLLTVYTPRPVTAPVEGAADGAAEAAPAEEAAAGAATPAAQAEAAAPAAASTEAVEAVASDSGVEETDAGTEPASTGVEPTDAEGETPAADDFTDGESAGEPEEA